MARNFYLVGWSTSPVSQDRVTNWREARRVHLDDCRHLCGCIPVDRLYWPASSKLREHMANVRAMKHAPLSDIESPSFEGRSAVWKVAQWSRHQTPTEKG